MWEAQKKKREWNRWKEADIMALQHTVPWRKGREAEGPATEGSV